MRLIIRKAAPGDAPALAEIQARAWEAAYTGIIPHDAIRERNAGRPAQWERVLAGEHNSYIALVRDVPVGLMTVHVCMDEDRPDTGEIGAIYLHPDHWGKGYGREMMAFALKALGTRGYSSASLWVLEQNARARGFYERCGFAPDGAVKEIVIGAPLIGMRYVRALGGSA